jgi:hypothetical protein
MLFAGLTKAFVVLRLQLRAIIIKSLGQFITSLIRLAPEQATAAGQPRAHAVWYSATAAGQQPPRACSLVSCHYKC